MSEKIDVAVPETIKTPIDKFIAEAVPAYNDMVDFQAEYKELNGTGDKVADFIKETDNEEIRAFAAQLEEAERKITEGRKKLRAKAQELLGDSVSGDVETVKHKYQDAKATLTTLLSHVKGFFLFSGDLVESTNEKGRTVIESGGTETGDLFVQLSAYPTISGAGSNNGEGKAIRDWANEVGWTDENNNPLPAQGKLPNAVKEAYANRDK